MKKQIRKNFRKNLIFAGIIVAVTIFAYWQLPQTFFQQDEWYCFSYTIFWQNQGFLAFIKNIFLPGGFAHLTPLSHIFNLILFNLFFPETSPFAVVSLTLHLLNAFLVFYFVKKLTGKRFAGFVASLVFAVCASGQQSVSWFSAFTGTETSTFFLLLTLIFFYKFMKGSNWRFYWLSLLTLLISLLFKETTIFLFAFLPVFYSIRKSPEGLKGLTLLKVTAPLGVLAAVFLLPRFLTASSEAAVAGVGAGGVKMILYNLLTIPIKTLYQVLVPPQVTFALSEKLLPRFYPIIAESYKDLPPYDFVVKDVLGDQISLVFGLIFFVWIIAFVILRSKATRGPAEVQCNIGVLPGVYPAPNLFWCRAQNDILFAFSFLLFSVLPFTILGKQEAYLPSRHYYIPAIGGGILLAIIFIFAIKSFTRFNLVGEFRKDLGNLLALAILFLFGFYILGNTLTIRADIREQVKVGNLRRGIIGQIMSDHPILPEKVVFYITGNSKGFYGVQNLKVPFQSGFGYVLLVNYYKTNRTPAEFFEREFLWDILAQGYHEVGSHGFGYFWQEEKLREAMKKYDLREENVIAYFYDEENEELKRISNCSNYSN